MSLTLEMLPAEHGDCLWLEYGRGRKRHRVVIDGGPDESTVLLDRVRNEIGSSRARYRIELLVITHVDDDHIGGVLNLLENLPSNVEFGDIWFNAYKHLLPKDRMGAAQGERLSGLLQGHNSWPWNQAWGVKKGDGAAVLTGAPAPLPRVRLTGGLHLTLVSPTAKKLEELVPKWKAECKRARLIPGGGGARLPDRLGRKDRWPPAVRSLAGKRPKKDPSKANGSSIGLLAEFGDTALLLAGDAHFDVLAESIERLRHERSVRGRPLDRLPVNALKVPHHGSSKNMSNDVLTQLACAQYLLSTSGKQFAHPDFEALSRIIVHGGKSPQLVFNYYNDFTKNWGEKRLRGVPRFRTRYARSGQEGVLLEYA